MSWTDKSTYQYITQGSIENALQSYDAHFEISFALKFYLFQTEILINFD